MASEKVKFKKQRRNRSFVSLENLDASEVTVVVEAEEQKVEVAQIASPLLKELHPTYILQKAYNRTKEIGSSTAMVGI